LEIPGESIDEVLIDAYARIQAEGTPNIGSRGPNRELIGVTLRIRHPRARLSRSADRGLPFSALGELLWYLTGTDDVDFITAYIRNYAKEVGPSGGINGAYGPRIFSRYGLDQLAAVKELLQRKPGSRRAVVQIYSATDLLTDEEVPCTTTLQFFLRDGLLHLAASLRSSDAYRGLPHDVFCFTMLQEMMARRLAVELGEYVQMIGSFHLYEKDNERVTSYLAEGHHRLAPMPRMPPGDPFPIVHRLLALESRIRRREQVDDEIAALDPYWGDLLRLVQVHFASDDDSRLDNIGAKLCEPAYRTYLEDRRGRPAPKLGNVADATEAERGPAT
jgi:thymidylate synthase